MKHLILALLLSSPAYAFSEGGFHEEPCPTKLQSISTEVVTSLSIKNDKETRLEKTSDGIGER